MIVISPPAVTSQSLGLGTAAFEDVGDASGKIPQIPVKMSEISVPVKSTIDSITGAGGDPAAFHPASDFVTPEQLATAVSALTGEAPGGFDTFLEAYTSFQDTGNALTTEMELRISGDAINAAQISVLTTEINDKESEILAGTTLQYWRGDKTWQTLNSASVGLGSVENTALSTWTGSSNLTTFSGGVFGSAATQDASAFDTAGAAASAQSAAISAAASDATTKANAAQSSSQPLDTDLTAIATLTTTTFGRSLLTMADGPAVRSAIGASSFNGTFGALTGVPTTLSGYGIVDAYPLSGNPSSFITTAGARTAISLTTTGTGAATYSGSTGVLNVPTPTSGTVTSVTLTQPSAGFTVSNSGSSQTSTASFVFTLSNDLASLEALSGAGIIPYRSGLDSWSTTTVSAPLNFTAPTLSITAATSGAAGSMSAADKAKLDSVTLFGGVNGRAIVKVTNTYTATVADDIILADTTSVAFTVNLPSPSTIFSGNRGKPITVICIGAKTLTVMPPSGTINGVAKDTVTAKYSGANYYSDGTNFFTE